MFIVCKGNLGPNISFNSTPILLIYVVVVVVIGVNNVINFDCPPKMESYIHRVGR